MTTPLIHDWAASFSFKDDVLAKFRFLGAWATAAAALLFFQGVISLATAAPDPAPSPAPVGETTPSPDATMTAVPVDPSTVQPVGAEAPPLDGTATGSTAQPGTKMKPTLPTPGSPTPP